MSDTDYLGENVQVPRGDRRSDSLIKLSSLGSLLIDVLDQPSSLIAALSSLHIGSTHSGCVAMSYKICVNA
jgi:hypothetical protein